VIIEQVNSSPPKGADGGDGCFICVEGSTVFKDGNWYINGVLVKCYIAPGGG
jgi:hypothetical protein